MQARRVGKCGDVNVHLCGEPALQPWRERCPALAPLPAHGGCGLGRRQALAAPSAVGSGPMVLPAPGSAASGSAPSRSAQPHLWVCARADPWRATCPLSWLT